MNKEASFSLTTPHPLHWRVLSGAGAGWDSGAGGEGQRVGCLVWVPGGQVGSLPVGSFQGSCLVQFTKQRGPLADL